MSASKTKNLSFVEKIFSVRNEGTRKVIRILGIRIQFRTPRLVYRELNARLEQAQVLVDVLQKKLEQQTLNFSRSLNEQLEQQTKALNNKMLSRLERQAQEFNSKINGIYAKLMYRMHEYCPDEKRAAAIKDWYFEYTGETLNLDNPKTFNEKIQWLKLYDSTPLKTRLADKYAVRDWVKEKIGEQYLLPLLGVWDRFEDIDFDKLPQKFVLKCNHGSGYNIIVRDKTKTDMGGGEKRYNDMDERKFCF